MIRRYRILFWASLAVSGALATLPAQSFEAREVQVPNGGSDVPMHLFQGVRATVQVMIDGKGPFTLGVETGTHMVIAFPALASALGRTGDLRFTADSVRLGAAVWRDQPFIVRPSVLPGIDGLLGLPFFSDVLLTLDYPLQRVRVSRDTLPPADGRTRLRLTRSGGFLAVSTTLGEQDVTGIIDTQSALALSVVPGRLNNPSWSVPLTAVGRAAVGGGAPVDVRAGRLARAFRLGAYSTEQPVVHEFPLPEGLPQFLTIGAPFLSLFRLTIDQRRHVSQWDAPAELLPRLSGVRAVGIGLAPGTPGVATVAALVPDGSGAEAGLRVGDTIVSIDGQPASNFVGPGQLWSLLQSERSVNFVVRRDVDLTLPVRVRTLVP